MALLVLTLVLSGAVFAGLEFYKHQAVGEVQHNVNETSGLVAQQISASISERRDYVGYVASRPQAARFEERGQFLDSFLANSRFYAAQLIASNGTIIAYRGNRINETTRQQAIGTNQTGVAYFEQGLRGAYVSDVRYAQTADQHVLIFSAPIFENGEPKGVLAAALFLNEQTVFDVVPPLETSDQQVIVRRGDTVLNDRTETFPDAIQSAATVETTGWTVVVERDRSALNKRLSQLALFQGASLALVLFSIVGFGYWQYAASLRQAERLLEAFDELQAGNYDYTVSLSGGTEWERIGQGVNDLSTGLREREDELRKRQQRLEVLHRVLRHNVRNKMSMVLNYADLIGDMSDEEMVVDAADTIQTAGDDLTTLSEKAGQLEQAVESSEPEALDVASMAREVVADMREQFPGIDLTVDAPETLRAQVVPSFRLAIENAVENACKHNDSDDPFVAVTVESLDSEVRIDVTDNGPGIPEQDRNAISEGRETDLEHGSGLGLWIVYWLVDNSDGELSFAENEPRGSIVRMRLPESADED